MIVQFQTNPGNVVTDYNAAYLNFLRCVTAIATAAAGTTDLTIRPLTSNNAVNSTQNCIRSIIANTEAGGWNVSTRHNVPGSPHAANFNTAQTYTTIPASADWLYVADFYNSSTKSTTPYKKLSFHSYNSPQSSGYGLGWYPGQSSSYTFGRTNVSASAGTNIQVTFGAASSMDWTDTSYAPGTNGTTTMPNVSSQNRSFTTGTQTITAGATAWNAGHALDYWNSSSNKLFTMAVTADYCIIWETYWDNVNYGVYTTSTTNPYTSVYSSGGGTTYYYHPYYGFIVYAGLRTTQAWEDTATNNVPWVVFSCGITPYGTGGTSQNTPFTTNQSAALMLTMTNTNVLSQATPRVFSTSNQYNRNWFWSGRKSTTSAQAGSGWDSGNRLDGPLFVSRAMASNTVTDGEAYNNSNILYHPQVDPSTGVMVPGAYPIVISRSFNNEWNAGGQIRGLYKSLSMPWTNLRQYWLSGTQTFTVNGEQFMPFVVGEDMFLVRYA
jgi:hypothetical protein